jgi:hypothetical protein
VSSFRFLFFRLFRIFFPKYQHDCSLIYHFGKTENMGVFCVVSVFFLFSGSLFVSIGNCESD